MAASFQTPTLFLIATDLTKMQIDTNVSESDIGGVKEGNETEFTVEAFADRTFRGSVTQVRQAPQTVQNVVTYDVVVDVDNSRFLLKPGMTATAQIVTDQRDECAAYPGSGATLCSQRYSSERCARHARDPPASLPRLGCCAMANRRRCPSALVLTMIPTPK